MYKYSKLLYEFSSEVFYNHIVQKVEINVKTHQVYLNNLLFLKIKVSLINLKIKFLIDSEIKIHNKKNLLVKMIDNGRKVEKKA